MSTRDYEAARIPIDTRCHQCNDVFIVYRSVKVGGRDHMQWITHTLYRICPVCAARNAAILYPEMRVITKH